MNSERSLLNDNSDENQSKIDTPIRYYVFKTVRYSTAVRLFLIIDVLLCTSLWISAGDSNYLIDSVTKFSFTISTFDLVVFISCKFITLMFLYQTLERISLKRFDDIILFASSLRTKKLICHFSIIGISLVTFIYTVTKASLIFSDFHNTNFVNMHLCYKILVMFAPCSAFVQLIASLLSFYAMNRLRSQQTVHYRNSLNEEVDEQGKVLPKSVSLVRLFKLAKPEAGLIVLGLLCLFAGTGAYVVAPLFFGQVIDAALKSMDDLNRTVLILAGVYFISSIGSMFRAWLFEISGQRLVARLRKMLFHSIIIQDIEFFDMNRTGELLNRLASDTTVIQNAITVNISMLVRNLFMILGSLVFMFILNASLTGVLLAIIPVLSVTAVQYGKYLRKLQKKFQDQLAVASTTAEESLSSLRTVRSFAAEDKAENIYSKNIDESYKIGRNLALLSGLFGGTVGICSQAGILVSLWYGGKLVNERQLSPGVLTAFLLYTLQVAVSFGITSSLYGDFMKAVGASLRMFELFDKKPKLRKEETITSIIMPDKLDLRFDDVSFNYPSRPENSILKNISFEMRPGQTVALVGPSGGGKSTIVSLIERFYDVDKGSIYLGGIDIKDLDTNWFRKRISLVSQEPVLFAHSIRDNIAYGREATDEQIIEAAKQANAHDFISEFEEGYKTMVGERGVKLSGGQKQRVAIARALLMDPAILLLDEATSALDAESEHCVQLAIDQAMINRTVLIIAHRLSTVRNASQVLVIKKGEIVERGTHQELLSENGIYKKLVLRQLEQSNTENSEQENGPGIKHGEDLNFD